MKAFLSCSLPLLTFSTSAGSLAPIGAILQSKQPYITRIQTTDLKGFMENVILIRWMLERVIEMLIHLLYLSTVRASRLGLPFAKLNAWIPAKFPSHLVIFNFLALCGAKLVFLQPICTSLIPLYAHCTHVYILRSRRIPQCKKEVWTVRNTIVTAESSHSEGNIQLRGLDNE